MLCLKHQILPMALMVPYETVQAGRGPWALCTHSGTIVLPGPPWLREGGGGSHTSHCIPPSAYIHGAEHQRG